MIENLKKLYDAACSLNRENCDEEALDKVIDCATIAMTDYCNITGEIKDLASSLYNQHFSRDSPKWEPLDSAQGLLSQLDNMVAGLSEKSEINTTLDQLSPMRLQAWHNTYLGYEHSIRVVAELIRINGIEFAPRQRLFAGEWKEIIIPIDTDHTAVLSIPPDAMKIINSRHGAKD